MKKTSVLFLLFLSIAFTQCDLFSNDSKDPETPKQLTLNDSQKELLVQSNNFGIQLFKSVPADKNLMISPLSASIALSMLLNGTDGQTATQMKDMLGYSGQSFATINSSYQNLLDQLLSADSKVNLSIANAIFYRESFPVKPSYLTTLKNSYNADVKGLDFASPDAISTINTWASDQTNGKINRVINDISSDAVLFLMNALYFKGNWSNQFDKDETSNQNFYLSNGNNQKSRDNYGKIGTILVISMLSVGWIMTLIVPLIVNLDVPFLNNYKIIGERFVDGIKIIPLIITAHIFYAMYIINMPSIYLCNKQTP